MRVSTMSPTLECSPPWREPDEAFTPAADRLADFLRPYAATFRRRDQARWLHVYLRGLLNDGPRKTIESIVRELQSDLAVPIRDLAQALQNFLNQSPWDERLLWREIRRAAQARQGRTPWVGVLDEVSIVKQGLHSVGVQRQYAGDSNRKQNCQVAIVLSAVTSDGAIPLACRLYLPRNWSSDPARLIAAGVPDEYHAPASRGDVALDLLDEALGEGLAFRAVVAGCRSGMAQQFGERLAQRSENFVVAVNDEFAASAETHRGLASIQDAEPLFESRRQAGALWQSIKSRYGLDHFEGRSWRGFHHHGALVALAYWFSFTMKDADSIPHDVVF